MSKRNRPNTAAQATHRRLRHAYRSAYNSPEAKAARGAAATKSAAATAKPAATGKPVSKPAAAPAAKPAPPVPKPPA